MSLFFRSVVPRSCSSLELESTTSDLLGILYAVSVEATHCNAERSGVEAVFTHLVPPVPHPGLPAFSSLQIKFGCTGDI
jgi:hypothetical protein